MPFSYVKTALVMLQLRLQVALETHNIILQVYHSISYNYESGKLRLLKTAS